MSACASRRPRPLPRRPSRPVVCPRGTVSAPSAPRAWALGAPPCASPRTPVPVGLLDGGLAPRVGLCGLCACVWVAWLSCRARGMPTAVDASPGAAAAAVSRGASCGPGRERPAPRAPLPAPPRRAAPFCFRPRALWEERRRRRRCG